MTRDVRAALLSAVATLMTMLALSPLLADRDWIQPVALVVLAVGLAATGVAAADLPRWLGPPVGALAGLVIATALLVPAQATAGGFVPTRTSVEALGILLRSGLATTQTAVPPAPTEAGVVTMLSLAAGAVAVLTLTIAGPLRRPGAAGLPLLLVVCVATALAPDGIGLLGYLSAALGYLALTLTDADQRVRAWGAVLQRRGRDGTPTASGVTEHLVAVAAVTAAVALVAGAALPLLTPGNGGGRLQALVSERFGSGGGGGGARSVNPFLDIRDDLASQDDTVLLRYATDDPDPDPLRIVTADAFDGAVWRPSPPDPVTGLPLSDGLPTPPGADAQVLADAPLVTTSVSVGPLAESFLPLPYPAYAVDVEGAWGYDSRTLNVLSADDTTEGLSYAATHYDIRPDAEQLDAVPADSLDPLWTQLPEDMSEVVLSEAQRVVAAAGAETRYDQALALQQWFRNSGGFTYSLDAPDVTDRDAVQAFLEDRRGYCVQFASTMALMARSLDVPARVAVGFLPGAETSPGQWEIRADDAHAWPELYFEGVGWVRFEPTPSTRTQLPPEWAVPRSEPVDPLAPVPSPGAQLPEQVEPGDAVVPPSAQGEDETGRDLAAALRQVGLVLVVLAVLAGVASLPRAWRWWRSRRRERRADGDDAAVATVAWTELLERLADLRALPHGATVREQAADLVVREQLPTEADDAVRRLAEAVERALYADEPAPTGGLADDRRTVLAAVAATRERRQRVAATWFPSPSPDLGQPRDRRVGAPVG